MSIEKLGASAPDLSASCFHCGEPLAVQPPYFVEIQGQRQAMCCLGCAAVARAIVDNDLTDFYRLREGNSPSARERVPSFLKHVESYDRPEVQRDFVSSEGEHVREAALILEGIVCAACVWLNEQHLAQLPGVLSVQINYATRRARLKWDARHIRLSEILRAIGEIGYAAHPYDPKRAQELLDKERQQYLRRMAVAGALGMQVMILAVALYVGSWRGMEEEYRRYFHGLSLLLTVPVLFYAGRGFFTSAWRGLRQRRVGMDVSVALGLSIAFAGSVWATFREHGEVYYDSVVMFIFFLLVGSYLELAARKRAAEAGESLTLTAPALATRLVKQGDVDQEEQVLASELQCGDRVLVRPGESVPVDGEIITGRSSVDESLFTGESLPLTKSIGERLIGGSINRESPLRMRVTHTGQETVLAAILRLLDRAQTEKPAITRMADRAASWFVARVLLLAVGVAIVWWFYAPEQWLPITVAVLVVSCPCALSLATPIAMTAATGSLMRHGLLVTRGHALETLARVTHIVFDKTGTLTFGRLDLLVTHCYGEASPPQVLQWAAALERHSEHPLGQALVSAASGHIPQASQVTNTPGAGLCGQIHGQRYVIGSPIFIQETTGQVLAADKMALLINSGQSYVLLANDKKILAAFIFGDEVRPGAREAVSRLQAHGKTIFMLTGDQQGAASRVAEAVGIQQVVSGLRPDEKLAHIKRLQEQGAVVAMIGDGINDSAALAAAHVSVAMGGGAQLAAANADMLLLSERLPKLVIAFNTAQKTLRVIRQNLVWAAAYNFLMLPFAALGFIAPWMAALGMSASSLLVVGNGLRLTHRPPAA